ncbi:uncharacterized protein LACBIDRAFT_328912 [Laccaria bicolor S238N-H82]|uniref:Predicted protein n=1 Tax=Laccaria bicolor (strain S238N-H82 / ATCC MYA-4686) TaxID=486041 RepID=B0DGE2_LACBS|nr:uncharacterized protein LACBIDRAFT_328912 [Laccaria bicolor S238N-H82]EDR06136.1 predicted protein [Laccaria bicolor S238N-H82]|eukprot:XP_001882997.1 predicted protein [Laccaria bicolor S238N-H82]
MSLPLELVRIIIDLLLFSAPPRSLTPEKPGCSTKPRWSTINALSLTSQSYRALVLEAWFQSLYIDFPGDLNFLRDRFPELGSKWTKHLHCIQSYHSDNLYVWNLSSFLRVSSIRLDWLSPAFSFPVDWNTLPFSHLSPTFEHFDLRGRTLPDPGAIVGIANTPGFAHLKTLKMVQSVMWCGLCRSCCKVQFKDRPTGVVYEGGSGLPFLYARVLAPLEYLEEVVIVTPNYGFGQTTLGLNADSDSNADTNPETTPTSKTNMDVNDAFREKWVARKRRVGLACGDGDNTDGWKDVRPPKLRRVEYQFSAADDEEEEIFEDYEEMFEIREDMGTSDSDLDNNGLARQWEGDAASLWTFDISC